MSKSYMVKKITIYRKSMTASDQKIKKDRFWLLSRKGLPV